MKVRTPLVGFAIGVLVCITLAPLPAWAGCGCDKPPPEPGPIIPDATYPGMTVKIYDKDLVPGNTYEVGIEGVDTLSVVADTDREGKNRVVVPIPDTCRVGPTSVRVTGGDVRLAIPSSAFTLVSKPVRLTETEGIYHIRGYRAAVDEQGRLLLSFDVSDVRNARNFVGQFLNKGLRMKSAADADFYNTQGFLMTDFATYELPYHIPGLTKRIEGKGKGSDMILYWRHEFCTWNDAHDPGAAHEMDPLDNDYHADGSRHVDHNHIILKVTGTHGNGGALKPGSIENVVFSIGVYADGNEEDVFDFKANPSAADYVTDYDEECAK